MEHILQFGVNIDDDKIVNSIYESAERQIVKDLQFKVAKRIFTGTGGWSDITPAQIESDSWTIELSGFAQSLIQGFFEDNKEQIINVTAKYLANKLVRTKAVKEMVGEVLAEQ